MLKGVFSISFQALGWQYHEIEQTQSRYICTPIHSHTSRMGMTTSNLETLPLDRSVSHGGATLGNPKFVHQIYHMQVADWILINLVPNFSIAGGDRVRRTGAELVALLLVGVGGDELGGGDVQPALLPHPPQNPLLLHASRLPTTTRPSLLDARICRGADEKVQTVRNSFNVRPS